MKRTFKFLGIIALVAVIGFTTLSCNDGGSSDEGVKVTVPSMPGRNQEGWATTTILPASDRYEALNLWQAANNGSFITSIIAQDNTRLWVALSDNRFVGTTSVNNETDFIREYIRTDTSNRTRDINLNNLEINSPLTNGTIAGRHSQRWQSNNNAFTYLIYRQNRIAEKLDKTNRWTETQTANRTYTFTNRTVSGDTIVTGFVEVQNNFTNVYRATDGQYQTVESDLKGDSRLRASLTITGTVGITVLGIPPGETFPAGITNTTTNAVLGVAANAVVPAGTVNTTANTVLGVAPGGIFPAGITNTTGSTLFEVAVNAVVPAGTVNTTGSALLGIPAGGTFPGLINTTGSTVLGVTAGETFPAGTVNTVTGQRGARIRLTAATNQQGKERALTDGMQAYYSTVEIFDRVNPNPVITIPGIQARDAGWFTAANGWFNFAAFDFEYGLTPLTTTSVSP